MTPPDTKIPEIKPPLCPGCKAELATLGGFSWTIPPDWLIVGVHCSACRLLLKVQIVPLAAISGPAEGSGGPTIAGSN